MGALVEHKEDRVPSVCVGFWGSTMGMGRRGWSPSMRALVKHKEEGGVGVP